jgi:hypothetical protein
VARSPQVELLARLQALSPTPAVMGGFAEDALLFGDSSRPHGDVDLLVDRSDLAGLLDQLRPLGYADWVTKGENVAGDPFYVEAHAGGVPIEIGVTDRSSRGELFLEVAKVHYRLETGEAPVGFRTYLPADTYDYPSVLFDGFPVRCISPLANYQLRAGFASRGTFGSARPHDLVTMERLRAMFFPATDESELLPKVEDI